MIGYPFMIAVGALPILLLTMAFTGEENLLKIVVFYGIIAVFAFSFLLLLSALRVAKKDFYKRRGVSSWKEYYSFYLSKKAKAEKLVLKNSNKAKAISRSDFLEARSLNENIDKLTISPVLSHSSKQYSQKTNLHNFRTFISASFYSLSAIILFTSFFLLSLNQQISFLWAILFFQGMFLSLMGSAKSIGGPFKTSQKTQPSSIKRLLFGKKAKDVDFKIFCLCLGVILVFISLLLFAFQEFANH